MTRYIRIFAAATMMLIAFLASPAHAVTVRFNNAYADVTITGSMTNEDGSTTYFVTYTFDFSTWDPNSCVDDSDDGYDRCGADRATHLGAIDFGFGGPENPVAELLSTNAPGVWLSSDVVANANGCDGGGHNSVCAQVDDPSLVAVEGMYVWEFALTYDRYVPDPDDFAIRAWFVECFEYEGCDNAGLMSLRSGVPEPGTLGLLGAALLVIGFSRRRRGLSL